MFGCHDHSILIGYKREVKLTHAVGSNTNLTIILVPHQRVSPSKIWHSFDSTVTEDSIQAPIRINLERNAVFLCEPFGEVAVVNTDEILFLVPVLEWMAVVE